MDFVEAVHEHVLFKRFPWKGNSRHQELDGVWQGAFHLWRRLRPRVGLEREGHLSSSALFRAGDCSRSVERYKSGLRFDLAQKYLRSSNCAVEGARSRPAHRDHFGRIYACTVREPDLQHSGCPTGIPTSRVCSGLGVSTIILRRKSLRMTHYLGT